MPLTQLSTLVLPAPFGPISANSSPARSVSETPSSTVRPPNRSVRRSISSSAIPSPAAAILLDLAIASSLAALAAQIEFLDVRVPAQTLGRAVEHDASILHHVTVIGDVEGHCCALLHEQNGGAEAGEDLRQTPETVLRHAGV